MLGKAIQPEIEEMIAERQFDVLRETLAELDVADIAEIIEDLPEEDRGVVFRLIAHDPASDVFEHLPLDVQEDLIRSLSPDKVGEILNAMSPDDRTRLLEELPGSVTQRLLKTLSPDELRVTRALLGYPEESIGRLMTPEYISVRRDWTVVQTLEHIRQTAAMAETTTYTYVVDERGRLIDDIHLSRLVMANPATHLTDLIEENVVALSAFDDRELAVAAFKKYDRTALPVIDRQGVLLGIVTVDDVLDVEEDEATEDLQKFGGMEALDAPYLEIALPQMVKKRAGWLSALFVGEMLTATAMGYYEHEISKAVVLALFIPLIISSGGNSGSQASTLVIRAMALGEVRLGDWWRVILREILTGIALGACLGVIGLIRIVLWPTRAATYGEHYMLIGFVVGFSLVGVVIFGTIAGATLPFILRRLNLDPASASAPFVATLVDVTGLIIYFTVASAILHGILL